MEDRLFLLMVCTSDNDGPEQYFHARTLGELYRWILDRARDLDLDIYFDNEPIPPECTKWVHWMNADLSMVDDPENTAFGSEQQLVDEIVRFKLPTKSYIASFRVTKHAALAELSHME